MLLKELIFNRFHIGGYSGLERTDFDCFYFGRVWQS